MSSSSERLRLSEVFNGSKPFLGVIMLQFGYAGSSIIGKRALNDGMNHFTFSVYRNIIASAVFAPFAIVFERKVRPTMTISIFLKIMLLSLLEPVIDQNLYYAGMKYSTATFSIAMCNILPAITFVMAWIFRFEKVDIRSLHCQGKIMGTIVTVGGAMIMTLVKGPTIGLPWNKESISHAQVKDVAEDPIKGAFMITAGCFCWAAFYILQAITLKLYPAALSLTTLICSLGAVQGTILTLVVEKGNTAIWSIHFDTKLLAALYSGIVSSGIAYYVSGLVMKERGPVFVTSFSPLSMVIVAILGSFVLSEQLDLGRVVGAIVIVVGLYLVVWGKSKDQRSSIKSDGEQIAVAPIDQEMASTDSDDGAKKNSKHDLTTVPRTISIDDAV